MQKMPANNKSQFLVRLSTAADRAACLDLDHRLETKMVWQMKTEDTDEQIQVSFLKLRLPRPIIVDYPRDRVQLEQEFLAADCTLIAEAEGVVLGYIHIMLNQSDQRASIRNLVVDQPYRRRRIGRALLEQASVWAKRHGARQIMLETTTRSYPAMQFMLAHGMVFCGFNERYYLNQDIAVFFGRAL